jgi:hypothetical protein
MTRLIRALVLLCLPLVASATDEGRFSYLEQEVRNLQRQVMALTRRLDDVSTRPERLAAPGAAAVTAPTSSTTWLDAGKWQRLRAGMSELEVVSLLGPPTTMRDVDGSRVLFYALEIGTSGFLGGSVRFRDRTVAEIQLPRLQ